MTVAEFKAKLKSADPSGWYIFAGEEEYLKRYYLDELRRAVITDEASAPFNHFIFDGPELDLGAVSEAIKAPPMMSEYKLIEWRYADLEHSKESLKAALDEMGVTLDRVVSIEVPDEAITERMTGRRVCSTCGATYHLTSKPSRDGKTCDNCHTELTVRSDDAPEVVLSRLKVYHETTEPLKDFYSKKGILKLVDGNGSVEQTSEKTLEAIGV